MEMELDEPVTAQHICTDTSDLSKKKTFFKIYIWGLVLSKPEKHKRNKSKNFCEISNF